MSQGELGKEMKTRNNEKGDKDWEQRFKSFEREELPSDQSQRAERRAGENVGNLEDILGAHLSMAEHLTSMTEYISSMTEHRMSLNNLSCLLALLISRWRMWLVDCPSFYLSVCLFVCLFVCLSIVCLSVFVCLSVCLSSVFCLSICLPLPALLRIRTKRA
jgi:hypothetical protein